MVWELDAELVLWVSSFRVSELCHAPSSFHQEVQEAQEILSDGCLSFATHLTEVPGNPHRITIRLLPEHLGKSKVLCLISLLLTTMGWGSGDPEQVQSSAEYWVAFLHVPF